MEIGLFLHHPGLLVGSEYGACLELVPSMRPRLTTTRPTDHILISLRI